MPPVVPTQPPPNMPPLDANGFLAANAPCIKCNYNLRALKPDGTCPECGSPVARSITGPLLRCAPPDRLLRLRTGLRLVLVSFVCLIFGPVIAIATTIASNNEPNSFAMSSWLLLTNVFLACGIPLTMSFHPANTGLGSRPERMISKTAAIGMLAPMMIMLLMLLTESLGQSDTAVLLAIAFYALLFGAAGAGFCRYADRILACCNRPAAGRIGTFLAIFFALSCLLVAFGAIAELAGNTQGDFSWIFIPWMLGSIVGLLCIIATIIFIPVVLRGVCAELKIAEDWANPPTDLAP